MPKIIARWCVLNLECEGLHVVCFHCGKYGYKVLYCFQKIIVSALVKNILASLSGGKPDGGETQPRMSTLPIWLMWNLLWLKSLV